MQKMNFGWLLIVLFLTACGSAAKDNSGNLNDKKAKLEKLKKEQQELNAEIAALQKDVASMDTNNTTSSNAKLVAISPVQSASFTHYVDLQGRIDATNISYVASPTDKAVL